MTRPTQAVTPTHTTTPASEGEVATQAASRCCGGPANDSAAACCVLDERIKSEGGRGCGCDRGPWPQAKATCC